MTESSSPYRRRLDDFGDILGAISRISRLHPVVLVGGHAVSAWVLAFEDSLATSAAPFLPLTSVDIDLWATRSATLALAAELGANVELSGPREISDGRIVLGVGENARRIDLLRWVHGLHSITLGDAVPVFFKGLEIPILAPHLLLQGKLANAVHLEQIGRQDPKHVELMVLVLGRFLHDAVKTHNDGNERAVLKLFKASLDVLTSGDAKEYGKRYKRSFAEVIPEDMLLYSGSIKLARFAKEYLPRHRPT